LYDRSSKNLTSEEHKKKLKELLSTNKNAFASNKSDLGSCSVLKHRIDTAGAAPMQPLRRTPLGFEQEEEKYLRKMIDTDVMKAVLGLSLSSISSFQ
jgi:hypothetical protein